MDALMECDLVGMRKFESLGNLKALADVRLGGSLVIRGCAVMDGKNGIFVSMPRRLNRDGLWHDVVVPENEDLRSQISELVLKAYQES